MNTFKPIKKFSRIESRNIFKLVEDSLLKDKFYDTVKCAMADIRTKKSKFSLFKEKRKTSVNDD